MKKLVNLITIFFMLTILIASANENHMIEKESFIDVPGGKIWYKIIYTEKSKNKTPLLVLHGGPGVPHDYLEVLSSIAKERPIIFYDQLGCGRSQILNNDEKLWTLSRYLNELEILIDHLHLNKVHLFGHSWGGAIAIEYALKHPEKVVSLTLASPLLSTKIWITDATRLMTKLPLNIQETILTNEKQGTTDSSEYKNAMNVYYQHFVFRNEHPSKKLSYSFSHINFDVYKTMWGVSEFNATGNLKDFDRMGDLHKLTMPVLLTGGEFDEATPETLKKAVALLQHGKLIIYKHSAHLAFLDEEEKYLTDLRIFLNAADRD